MKTCEHGPSQPFLLQAQKLVYQALKPRRAQEKGQLSGISSVDYTGIPPGLKGIEKREKGKKMNGGEVKDNELRECHSQMLRTGYRDCSLTTTPRLSLLASTRGTVG